MELYEWNLDLGAALMKDIAYFEVALRNAYDRMMRERYVEGGNWLLDDQSPVNRELPRKTRSGSVRDANALNRIDICRDGAGILYIRRLFGYSF